MDLQSPGEPSATFEAEIEITSTATPTGEMSTPTPTPEQTLDPCIGNSDLSMCQTTSLQIGEALGSIIQFAFVIAVILALGFLVYGGIRWITSGGDKGNVETARGTIIASIIGLIIVFLSFAILNLVLNFLTGSGIGDISIPSLANISEASPANAQARNSEPQGVSQAESSLSKTNPVSSLEITPDTQTDPSDSVPTKGGIGY